MSRSALLSLRLNLPPASSSRGVRLAIAILVALVSMAACSASSRAEGPEKIRVFEQHQNGFFSYRIPGIVVTAKGTVLIYCEARKFNGNDRDEIEIHMRRSTDGGKSFSPAAQVAHFGLRLPRNPVGPSSKEKKELGGPEVQTVNNACAVADRNGDVHLLYCVEYMRNFYVRSSDDGLTWTKPVAITATCEAFRRDIDWQSIAFGPGHGIQLRSGRLLVPVWMSDYRKTEKLKHAAATIFSDDGGKTWQRGDIAIPDGNESQAAELSDGSVMLSARNSNASGRRALATSPDGAAGWSQTRFQSELLEPGCMAGLFSYPASKTPDGKPLLLFSNPPTSDREHTSRANVSIRASRDDGKTWPIIRRLQEGPSAYSDLGALPDGTILCLYESGQPGVERPGKSGKPWPYANLTLARFGPEWVLQGDDK